MPKVPTEKYKQMTFKQTHNKNNNVIWVIADFNIFSLLSITFLSNFLIVSKLTFFLFLSHSNKFLKPTEANIKIYGLNEKAYLPWISISKYTEKIINKYI